MAQFTQMFWGGQKFQNIYIMSETYFQLLGGSVSFISALSSSLFGCLSVGRFGWPIGLVLLSVLNGLKGVEETFLAIKNFEHVLVMYSFLFPIIQAPRRVYTRHKKTGMNDKCVVIDNVCG